MMEWYLATYYVLVGPLLPFMQLHILQKFKNKSRQFTFFWGVCEFGNRTNLNIAEEFKEEDISNYF